MYSSSEKTYNNYVWDERTDLLGTGATSNVFRARCKNTGHFYAVKVFTDNKRCVANPTLLRELSILEMVDHRNIVKLIKDDSDRRRQFIDCIIMEYCNGGNLATIIEKPENYFGLPESEFLLVLKHITDGMIELNRKNIAHRDIKPNNILLHILNNGEHVYKITDFGAAKNFENANLNTTVGTEEYLYPEIYERAFYNTSTSELTPGIDLWSIGVTLYHVATGKLPFRPYDGCRKDRNTMIKITKEKPSGYISGVQTVQRGPIEYNKFLPATCQLSAQFRSLLEPMLAGLIETDLEKMWPFDKYFEESTRITSLVYINVVSAKTHELVEVALKSSEKLNTLIDSVAKATGTPKEHQLLLYNNLLLASFVTPNQDIGTYTIKTDDKNPLVLFDLDKPLAISNSSAFEELPRLNTRMPNRIATATAYCKEISGLFYEFERKIIRKSLINEVLKQSALTIRTQAADMKLKQENMLNTLRYTTQNLETKSASFAKIYDCISRLDTNKSIQAYREQTFNLSKIKVEINEYEAQLKMFNQRMQNLNGDNLNVFMKDQAIEAFAKYIRRINEECENLYNEFQQEKRSTYRQDSPLSTFGEFKCKKLNSLIDDAFELYNKKFISHIREFYMKYQKWFNDLIKFNKDINQVETKLSVCQKSLENCKIDIDKDIDSKLNRIIDYINNQIHVAPAATVVHEVKPRNSNEMNTAAYNNKIGFERLLTDINPDNDASIVENYNSIDSLVKSIDSFKKEASETDKILDDTNGLLKYLLGKFNINQQHN